MRKKAGADDAIPSVVPNEMSSKEFRHLDLWNIRNHDPPVTEPVYISELVFADSEFQVPAFKKSVISRGLS